MSYFPKISNNTIK